jgi:ubiquinone/menaquinone biosynthesis C-methylase UbiE
MANRVASHYSENLKLADAIAAKLLSTGKDLNKLTTTDLATVDEFHIRGRKATLELGEKVNLSSHSHVLDIGSGLGGPARTLAETYGCRVTGIDLTQAFCDAATAMSDWVGLGGRVSFKQGDATNLPFENQAFDAAMTIHVAMNIAAKDKMYLEARRVLKPGGVFAVYDVLQGEGGDVLYPVPWAREPSISHLETPDEMKSLLISAGFKLLDVQDSTQERQSFFEKMTAQMAKTGTSPVIWQLFLGDDFPAMARNQVRNVTERRIRTVSYFCTA